MEDEKTITSIYIIDKEGNKKLWYWYNTKQFEMINELLSGEIKKDTKKNIKDLIHVKYSYE